MNLNGLSNQFYMNRAGGTTCNRLARVIAALTLMLTLACGGGSQDSDARAPGDGVGLDQLVSDVLQDSAKNDVESGDSSTKKDLGVQPDDQLEDLAVEPGDMPIDSEVSIDLGPSCNHECPQQGGLECVNGSSYKTCSVDSEGCRVWTTATNCAEKSSCDNGVCIPDKCPNSDCDALNDQQCNGKGYQVCTIDPNTGCPKLGQTVLCRDDDDQGPANCTTGGQCVYAKTGCVESPRVVLLVDRSSSMLKQKLWAGTKLALNVFVREYWDSADFGLRLFPGGDTGCGVGELILEKDIPTADDFTKLLKDPAGDGATALADALDNIVIGDNPQDETHVILLTDGQETCKTNSDVFNSIYKLRGRGIKVHVIGIGETFNAELLQQAAILGGTDKLHIAKGGHDVYRALLEVSQGIQFCCIDHDGDGYGRHCGTGKFDCNDGNQKVTELTTPSCNGQSCGIDNCGNSGCGVCGPEGDMSGLQSGARWPQSGFSPTQQRRSPNYPPAFVFQGAKLYELDWSAQMQSINWKVDGALAIDNTGAIYLNTRTKIKADVPEVATLFRYQRIDGVTNGHKVDYTLGTDVVSYSAPAIIRTNLPPSLNKPAGLVLGSNNGLVLFFIDKSTVHQVGGYELYNDPANPHSAVTVAGDGSILFVTQARIYSLQVNIDNSSSHTFVKWFYPTGSFGGPREPAIGGDGTIYVAGGNLLALTPQGEKKWETAQLSLVGTPVVGKDGTIYVLDQNGRIYAFLANGAQKWSVTDGMLAEGTIHALTRLAIAEVDQTEYLIFVNRDANLVYAVDTSTRGVQKASIPKLTIPRPVIAKNGLVLFGTKDKVQRWTIGSTSVPAYELEPESVLLAAPLLSADNRLVVFAGKESKLNLQIYKSKSN